MQMTPITVANSSRYQAPTGTLTPHVAISPAPERSQFSGDRVTLTKREFSGSGQSDGPKFGGHWLFGLAVAAAVAESKSDKIDRERDERNYKRNARHTEIKKGSWHLEEDRRRGRYRNYRMIRTVDGNGKVLNEKRENGEWRSLR